MQSLIILIVFIPAVALTIYSEYRHYLARRAKWNLFAVRQLARQYNAEVIIDGDRMQARVIGNGIDQIIRLV